MADETVCVCVWVKKKFTEKLAESSAMAQTNSSQYVTSLIEGNELAGSLSLCSVLIFCVVYKMLLFDFLQDYFVYFSLCELILCLVLSRIFHPIYE